jgi:hypothetical protein
VLFPPVLVAPAPALELPPFALELPALFVVPALELEVPAFAEELAPFEFEPLGPESSAFEPEEQAASERSMTAETPANEETRIMP